MYGIEKRVKLVETPTLLTQIDEDTTQTGSLEMPQQRDVCTKETKKQKPRSHRKPLSEKKLGLKVV